MAKNLTDQVRSIATVTTAVADGDLTKKITVDAKGEILDLKLTVNSMVDSLRMFAAEVTRVAREVGTDGILGGQAEVAGVSGEWRGLTDSVNTMSRRVSVAAHEAFNVDKVGYNSPLTVENRSPSKFEASLSLQ